MHMKKNTCDECGGDLHLEIFKMNRCEQMPFHYRHCRHDIMDRFFNTHTSKIMVQYYKKVFSDDV